MAIRPALYLLDRMRRTFLASNVMEMKEKAAIIIQT